MKGPRSKPSPRDDSIRPIYLSLSSESKDIKIAMHAVEFAPEPIPPKILARKLKTTNCY
jgi:hypothetical protein